MSMSWKRYVMNLSALTMSGINGRYGTTQGKKYKPISENFISFSRNSSSESPFTDADSSESSEDIPLPSNTNSIVDSSIELAHEVFRCSTPLHLPCSLEFSFSDKTTTENLSDSSSSADHFALLEGSDISVDKFQELFLNFVVRHKLPDNALKELLTMFKQLLPRPNNVPKNLSYRRKKIDSDGIEVLEIRKQLSRIIERNHDVLADVTTVTLFISTDGATPFRSAKKDILAFLGLS